ncbi:hypothetical protein C8R44DRAFT_979265, partial [Mycena epipterygia]
MHRRRPWLISVCLLFERHLTKVFRPAPSLPCYMCSTAPYPAAILPPELVMQHACTFRSFSSHQGSFVHRWSLGSSESSTAPHFASADTVYPDVQRRLNTSLIRHTRLDESMPLSRILHSNTIPCSSSPLTTN